MDRKEGKRIRKWTWGIERKKGGGKDCSGSSVQILDNCPYTLEPTSYVLNICSGNLDSYLQNIYLPCLF